MSEFSEILNHPYQLLGINLNHWGITVSPPNSASGSLFAPHESQTPRRASRFLVHATMVKSSKSMAEMTAGSTSPESAPPAEGQPNITSRSAAFSDLGRPGRGSRPSRPCNIFPVEAMLQCQQHTEVEGNFDG